MLRIVLAGSAGSRRYSWRTVDWIEQDLLRSAGIGIGTFGQHQCNSRLEWEPDSAFESRLDTP